jgi:hypothetical protein
MAELKTKPSKASVAKFIESIADNTTRKDCQALIRIMKQVTGVPDLPMLEPLVAAAVRRTTRMGTA